jgi:hypothetical protein
MVASTRSGPGGGQPIVQRISLTGAEEVKRLLEQMGAQGEKAAAQIGAAMKASGGDTAKLGQAVEGAFVKLGGAGAALKPTTQAVNELHSGFRGIGGTLNNVATVLLPDFTSKMGLGIAGVVLALKGVLGNAKSSILEMRNLSLQTGLSINALQGIKDVFEDQGVPVEKLATVVGKFSEELGKARLEAQKLDGPLGSPFVKAGEKVTVLRGDLDKVNSGLDNTTTVLRGAEQQMRDTSSAFASLGMNAEVLKRFPDTVKGNFEALVEFSRRLNAVADDTERGRIGAQLFGRQWRTEAAGILAIAKNLEDAMNERIAKGLTISEDETKRTLEYTKAVHDLGDQWERVSQVIGVGLFPLLTWLGKLTEESVQNMRETSDAYRNLVFALGDAIKREWQAILDAMKISAEDFKTAVLQAIASIIPGLSLALQLLNSVRSWTPGPGPLGDFSPRPQSPPSSGFPFFSRPGQPAPSTPGSSDNFGEWSPRPADTGDWGDWSERPASSPTPNSAPSDEWQYEPRKEFELAGGGQVGGIGFGDIVPAWLTPNEFVMKVAAVKKYGLDFMHRINSMQLPKFELGGMVDGIHDATAQFFAGGGRVAGAGGGRSEFTIVLDRQPFSASADRGVAQSLLRTALKQKMVQANRKPGSRI